MIDCAYLCVKKFFISVCDSNVTVYANDLTKVFAGIVPKRLQLFGTHPIICSPLYQVNFCRSLVPRAFSSFKMAVEYGNYRETLAKAAKWLQKFVRISLRKHNEMSSFRLNNGFRLQKTNRAARR